MPDSDQKKYFHQKAREADIDLKKVSSLYRFKIPFFDEPAIIPVPHINKVNSLDTWLNNVSNVFKTIGNFSKSAVCEVVGDHKEFSNDFPLAGFCLDALAAIIYKIVELMPKEEKNIEMQSMC